MENLITESHNYNPTKYKMQQPSVSELDITHMTFGNLWVFGKSTHKLTSKKGGFSWLTICSCRHKNCEHEHYTSKTSLLPKRDKFGTIVKLGKRDCGAARREIIMYGDMPAIFYNNLEKDAMGKMILHDNPTKYMWETTPKILCDIFIAQGCRCFLTRQKLTFDAKEVDDKFVFLASLDRINNKYHYVDIYDGKQQLQWLTKETNMQKHKYTNEMMIRQSHLIAKAHPDEDEDED